MSEGLFVGVFLLGFAAEFAVHWWLDGLNRNSILAHPQPPIPFDGLVDKNTYQRSREYALTKLAYSKWERWYSAILALTLLFSGVLVFWEEVLARLQWPPVLHGVAYLGALALILGALKWPFSLYQTFVLEGRYGFNRMTWKAFLGDTAKGVMVYAALGLPALAVLLWFLRKTGSHWWIWTYCFAMAFQIVLLFIYPVLIAPLFNRFRPLPEGVLKNALLALTSRLRFPIGGIYVMDGSRRSTHSNAYFTGFGRLRRIVLYDTLVERMNVGEIEGVLCHEIGHYKMGHLYKMLAYNALVILVVFWLLSSALEWPVLYNAFGFEGTPAALRHVGLFLFAMVASVFGFFITPVFNLLSRRYEFEADAFAARQYPHTASLESALVKLAKDNLTNLTPHPWYSAFHYSHPTMAERLSALKTAAAQA